MRLIIAEKPSLARNIVAGIGTMSKKDGYYEGEGYLVSWAFGHLFSLCDIEDYTGDPPKTKWTLDNLPCFPDKFNFKLKADKDGKVDGGVRKQFKILSELMNRSDVDMIINAGDADREGEIIVRLCMKYGLKSRKQIMRLWLPDQTPETVSTALKDMKPDAEYNNLANEGLARTYIDWLYGVNLTRFATLKAGSLLRVGRVICPIVKAVYDRDMAISNFKPEKYYALVSKEETNGEVVELTSQHKIHGDQLDKAQRACDALNSQEAIVTDKKKKKDKLNPCKLFSLTKLQNYLGKKYKMSMDKSLDIVQSLYEAGYLTYPRTNSEYLATAEKDKIKEIIGLVAGLGYPVAFRDSKTIFDDSKIESHSALTPTRKIPDPKKLSPDEMNVYSAVLRRFVAVFCSEECIAEKTEMTITVGKYESFTLKGTVLLQPGWTKYDDTFKAGKILPNLNKGDRVNILFKPTEKMTSPPKHYTIETLNNYLKNPFREDKASATDDDDYKAIFEGLELGTEATRTGIIDNAIKSKYIALEKDVYKILPDGVFFIEALQRMGIIMDKYKTSTLGQALKKVYHATMSVDEAVSLAKTEIKQIFELGCNDSSSSEYVGNFGDEICKCPLCGKSVRKYKYSYGCEGYKEGCTFKINQIICGKTITLQMAKNLLLNGSTDVISGFASKSGKSFSAKLVLKDGKVEFEFPERAQNGSNSQGETIPSLTGKSVGKCPVCGKDVTYHAPFNDPEKVDGTAKKKGFYGCTGYSDGCKFGFSECICEREITPDTASDLLKKGKTDEMQFVAKSGKTFYAKLVLNNGKVKFEFDKKDG